MFILTVKFDRKTAVFLVLLCALLLIGVIALAGAHSKARALEALGRPSAAGGTERARVAYLRQYGWEVESPPLSQSTVLIPRQFNDVLENYNRLQRQQGFDLSRYRGMEVTLYTYKVLHAPGGEEAVAQLYVLDKAVIGGDVHSTRLDGFMVGVKPAEEQDSLRQPEGGSAQPPAPAAALPSA